MRRILNLKDQNVSQTRENQDAALDQRFQAWLRERGGIAGC